MVFYLANFCKVSFEYKSPAIARFTSIVPVTHHSMSTYTAFDNNPVYWADPSGADAVNLQSNIYLSLQQKNANVCAFKLDKSSLLLLLHPFKKVFQRNIHCFYNFHNRAKTQVTSIFITSILSSWNSMLKSKLFVVSITFSYS